MLLERLQSLPQTALSLDTETWRIEPGCDTPPIVCGSAAWFESGPRIGGVLLPKHSALETFAQALEDPNITIVGANVAYDLMVFAVAMERLGIDAMPTIFAALAAGRVYDILIAEPLNAIAHGHLGRDPRTGSSIKNPETGKNGSYSLNTVTDMLLGRPSKVNDEWRLRYRELDDVPIEDWPQAARDYPVDDARDTLEDALAQTGHMSQVAARHRYVEGTRGCADCGSFSISDACRTRRSHLNLHQVADQTYSAFVLRAGAAWGLEVDQAAVDKIEAYALRRRAKLIGPFIEAGLLDPEDKTENRNVIKRKIAVAYGSTETCPICAGSGKVPKRKPKTLTCPDCRGRCVPWKAGGKIKDPTVASCARCTTTGRVPHPKPDLVNCILFVGEKDEEKTCDGSGLVLVEAAPRSDGGGIGIGRDSLTESGDDELMAFGYFKEDEKILKDYVPFFRTARVPVAGHAAECPKFEIDDQGGKKSKCTCLGPYLSVTMNLKPNPVLATGRVSYRGYFQLIPRKPGFKDPETGEYIPSLRECFVARSGPTYRYYVMPNDHVLCPGEELVAC